MLHRFDLWPWATGGAFYVIGAVLYALNWPECWSKKGRFDYIGNSHNIFHVCIVIAALVHWFGSVRCFHERQLFVCPV
jgi:adiponectin receptor